MTVKQQGAGSEAAVLTCGFALERVTGIEPALSAWELDRSGPFRPLTWQLGIPGVAVIVRSSPWLIAR